MLLLGRRCWPASTAASWRTVHSASFRGIAPRRNPSFHDLAGDLKGLPAFRTRGEDVRVIYEPVEFYKTLLHRISTAKRRIYIASLYIGKEETELVGFHALRRLRAEQQADIILCLQIEALRTALTDNPTLEVVILLDYLRSTRETPLPSSASLVASLCASFPDRVDFRLYHTPELTGWRKSVIPRRFDEGWGLQHMKCYGFDDTVLISGANLSNDYFSNRQDRYIEFLSNPPLSDYFSSLIQTTSSLSFRATASDTSTPHPTLKITWPSTNLVPSPLDSSTSIPEFKQSAHESFTSLTKIWVAKPSSALSSTLPATVPKQIYDTLLYPVLQMGPFNISQETDTAVPAIFRAANSLATAPGGSRTTIDWTSGYFSVQEAYLERVLDSKALVRIITASPEANGFFNSKGVSKYIPPAYTYLQKQFYDQTVERARKRNRDSHVELREWKRQDWTYHAKGIWLTPSTSPLHRVPIAVSPSDQGDDNTATNPSTPLLTLIGSSNYGRRSATRDLEANLLITTTSSELRGDLREEVLGIRHFAGERVGDELFKRKERIVGRGVRVAARAIEDML